ncbi:MAG: sigma-70 family RNA polymerase sigma factor [Bacteroidota bacterium]
MKSYQTESTARLCANQRDLAHLLSFKNGNSRALDEFYLKHRREFLKWAEKIFGIDSAEALDVYQDAILILYENIHRGKLYQLDASLKTYFFGICKNLILKKLARSRSEKKRWEVVIKEGDQAIAPDYDKVTDHEEMRLDAVVSALNGLSERNQSILKLYYYNKLSLKDIAEQLGYESVDVVKNQKVRCMKYLKKLLSDEFAGINEPRSSYRCA